MGKRSDFERVERDFYPTPYEAVVPLLPHLTMIGSFAEPCAGDGALIRHLEKNGFHCGWSSDIEPQEDEHFQCSYEEITASELRRDSHIITNPPWDRKILHPMIEHFCRLKPTWLLFDADWMHTIQEIPAKKYGFKKVPELMKYCVRIVSVGRVKWIPDSKMTGKDNCAWYLFDARHNGMITEFVGRV